MPDYFLHSLFSAEASFVSSCKLFPKQGKPWKDCGEEIMDTRGPFLESPGNLLIVPAKPLLSNLYLQRGERSLRLNLVVRREPLFILKNM